ncbi:MAG: hypothetical protein K5866_04915 [Treponema sp.]|nr:hypothetical protein [Treponema sp.]
MILFGIILSLILFVIIYLIVMEKKRRKSMSKMYRELHYNDKEITSNPFEEKK